MRAAHKKQPMTRALLGPLLVALGDPDSKLRPVQKSSLTKSVILSLSKDQFGRL
jgi:hypothetical protein